MSNRRCGDMIVGGGDTAVGGMHQSTGRKSGASNGSGHSYTGSKGFTQRSNKTLGWFLNDGLLSSASGDNRINKNAGESESC
ncbi:unnamed protein product [Toxocara canis]|uniref:Uncharacterized protein n=1 Tax=Toxocara canis TaxID=6265 RepID=A0A3P7IBR6_TOXCA|nr:unnamed protein product [Toxocara canis]